MAANKRATRSSVFGTTEVTTYCPYHSGYNEKVVVDTNAWLRYESGNGLVDNLFPDLTAYEREMLRTGICQPCWDEILGPEEEEINEALS